MRDLITGGTFDNICFSDLFSATDSCATLS